MTTFTIWADAFVLGLIVYKWQGGDIYYILIVKILGAKSGCCCVL